jgi:hypothetical protein
LDAVLFEIFGKFPVSSIPDPHSQCGSGSSSHLNANQYGSGSKTQKSHPESQCCGSDPNFSIPDPGSASKNLRISTSKQWFLRSRKYDLGCSSRIRILTFYQSRIPVKKAPDPGSGTLRKVTSIATLAMETY